MFKHLLALLALSALGACGSSGGGTQVGDGIIGEALFPVQSTADTKSISVFGLDRTNDTTFRENTTLVPTDTIQSGRLAGVITFSTTSGGRNFITKSNGDTIDLTTGGANGSDYTFVAADGTLLAVAGQVSPNVPSSGVAAYFGAADVVVNDGTDITTLTTMNATANFSTDRVTITFGGAGSKSLSINDATISGSAINNGNLSATNFSGSPTGGAASLSHRGSFFGPDGAELGGVFTLDENNSGNPFSAAGVYSSN